MAFLPDRSLESRYNHQNLDTGRFYACVPMSVYQVRVFLGYRMIFRLLSDW